MNGAWALTRKEMVRLSRKKRYLIFSIAPPVMLYLVFGKQATSTAYGVAFKAFHMVGMASVGAFSGALTGNAQRISQERKDGWVRQLRLTLLPPQSYVVAKIIASMATTVPAIAIVLALGHFYGGVQLAGWKWLAIGAAIWLGTMTFAALAVAIGYWFMPDTVQPVTMFVYFLMSILGGLWFPARRRAAEGRPGTAHRSDHQDRHGRDRYRDRVDDLDRDDPGLARRLHRAGGAGGTQHSRDDLSRRVNFGDPAGAPRTGTLQLGTVAAWKRGRMVR